MTCSATTSPVRTAGGTGGGSCPPRLWVSHEFPFRVGRFLERPWPLALWSDQLLLPPGSRGGPGSWSRLPCSPAARHLPPCPSAPEPQFERTLRGLTFLKTDFKGKERETSSGCSTRVCIRWPVPLCPGRAQIQTLPSGTTLQPTELRVRAGTSFISCDKLIYLLFISCHRTYSILLFKL